MHRRIIDPEVVIAVLRNPPLLRLSAVRKHYGGVRALVGADLVVDQPGEIHTLIGENGSGKSSLLGILSGQIRPDGGTIELEGRRVSFRDPADALRQGIAMVSQETAVAPALSVTENVLLGRLPGTAGRIDWAAARRLACDVLMDLGLESLAGDPDRAVGTLRPDQRQMVEIARALSTKARILILDEPTSSLTDDEIKHLFAAVERLCFGGVAVLFVSHRLPETFRISDTITVLREGRTVASGPVADFTPHTLVKAMIGTEPAAAASPVAPHSASRALLTVRGLGAPGAFADVDLDVGQGEIVGVAGLVGSGRGELLEALFGVLPGTTGTMQLGGAPYRPREARDAITARVGYLPPDRKTQGLVLTMSVEENLTLVAESGRPRFMPPDAGRRSAAFARAKVDVRLRADRGDAAVGTLSGGNQQKVAIAKWLAITPRLLLLDEPTRGVDVTAKAEIHERLRELAQEGLALLVSSSENPELLALCHRIVVMSRGRVVAQVDRADTSEAALAALAGGHR